MKPTSFWAVCCTFCIVWAACAAARAQMPRNADPIEQTPIRRNATTGPTTRTATTPPTGGGLDLMRLAGSMVIVLGLIFAAAWVAKKLGGPRSFGGGGAVRVLSRNGIGPRQSVMLVKVGSRVIVVADSNGTLSPLSEITDESEIARLIHDLTPPEKIGRFGGLLRRENDALGDESNLESSPSESPPDQSGEISSLMRRVRALSQQFQNKS
jgi:flagellar biosynthetic protein FliO